MTDKILLKISFFIVVPPNKKAPDLLVECFSLSINLKIYFCGVYAAFSVFPLTCAAEKHLVSEKPLIKWFFKGTGVVLAGIECSPKIFDFRASGISVQECVDFSTRSNTRSFSRVLKLYIMRSLYIFRNPCRFPLPISTPRLFRVTLHICLYSF